jgi:hypothetical protein
MKISKDMCELQPDEIKKILKKYSCKNGAEYLIND